MSLLKKIALGLLAILVLLQFIRPARNQSNQAQLNDIFNNYPASDTVQALLRKSCYDCHSNNTRYPWYTEVQPVGLWLQHHVDEGKEELNFSEFSSYPAKKADRKLHEAIEEINEHEMPLSSYTLIHREAKLNDAQRRLIVDWIKGVRSKIGVAAKPQQE